MGITRGATARRPRRRAIPGPRYGCADRGRVSGRRQTRVEISVKSTDIRAELTPIYPMNIALVFEHDAEGRPCEIRLAHAAPHGSGPRDLRLGKSGSHQHESQQGLRPRARTLTGEGECTSQPGAPRLAARELLQDRRHLRPVVEWGERSCGIDRCDQVGKLETPSEGHYRRFAREHAQGQQFTRR